MNLTDPRDPNRVTFSASDSPTARATFKVTGRYVLLLTANDGAGAVSDPLTVFVRDGERKSKDIILVAEHSRYQIGTPPENFAQRRASQFVDFIPLNQDQVGLVGYGDYFNVFLQ